MSKKPLTRRQRIGLILMAGIVIGGLCYWLFTNVRWEEKEIDLGYSSAAKQNAFLAAEIFLRKQGVPAVTVKNLNLLDTHHGRNINLGQDDTIVLINTHKTLTQSRYDRLYEWIENGGTLIATTQNPFIGSHTREEDLLLRDFNITPVNDIPSTETKNEFDLLPKKEDADHNQKQPEQKSKNVASETETETETETNNALADKKSSKKENEEKPENYYRCNLESEPTEIEFSSEEKPLHFDFSKHAPFIYHNDSKHTDHDEIIAEDDKTSHMLYFNVGKGGISITSDTTIWSNHRIDCHDHAYALWRMVNHDGRVWFLINQEAPSLAAILWRNAPYGVLAALLTLLLWLWAKSQRFGPVFVHQETVRRSLAEHIFASAMLLWRNQQHPQLLTLLRQQIFTHLLEQHPQLTQVDNKQRVEFLQELTGIHRDALHRALYADDLYQPQDFANAIAHLQTIRKQL